MNRKLGQMIKAAIFALPFALPGVALAQSATGSTGSSAQDTANQGTLDQTQKPSDENAGSLGNSNSPSEQQPSGMGTGSQQGTSGTSDYNPPAGSLDKSGSSSTTDRNLGGDMNKSQDTSGMNKESTGTSGTTTKEKKSHKTSKRSTSESSSDTSSDMNK